MTFTKDYAVGFTPVQLNIQKELYFFQTGTAEGKRGGVIEKNKVSFERQSNSNSMLPPGGSSTCRVQQNMFIVK